MLNKDLFSHGLITGLLTVVVSGGLLSLLALLWGPLRPDFAQPDKLYIMALVPNLFWFRYYFVKMKFERSGQGVLVLTFALVIVFFLFLDKFLVNAF